MLLSLRGQSKRENAPILIVFARMFCCVDASGRFGVIFFV